MLRQDVVGQRRGNVQGIRFEMSGQSSHSSLDPMELVATAATASSNSGSWLVRMARVRGRRPLAFQRGPNWQGDYSVGQPHKFIVYVRPGFKVNNLPCAAHT